VAVPIDRFLRCVALVRGLPATRALMTTNDGVTMVCLTWRKAKPAKRLEVVPAACLRHLRTLLKMHARHVCTARSRQSRVLELPQCARSRILIKMPPIRFCTVRGPRTLLAPVPLQTFANTLCSFNTPEVFFTE
jgi:hypothetical protein